MAFRKVPMAKGAEQVVAPEGEYRLVVRKVTSKQTKKGAPLDVLLLTFADNPEYAPFNHFITYPAPGDEYEEMRIRDIRRLCHLFDVPYSEEGIDTDDFAGAEATCRVTVEVYEPEDGSASRENNRLVLPRVAD